MTKMEPQGRRSFLGIRAGIIILSCCIAGVEGDIPDGVVYTDVHKTVQNEYMAVLKCEFYGVPIAVYWKKGDNPSTSPNLITWVEGEPPSGSCVLDKSCEMNDQYSLIIKNTRIPDQGRYICRVSNYRGILIHNYTDVKIYAPPKEPFPVIDECVKRESITFNSTQPCSILINTSTVFMTCAVTDYYPALDLFFLHGSQKIPGTVPKEWTNNDGTKNKSISIEVSASETPYICVASGIPGSNDQRAATILLKFLTPAESTITATEGSSTSTRTVAFSDNHDNRSTKIAVPVVLVVLLVGIGLVMLFVFRCRRQQEHEEDVPEYQDTTLQKRRNSPTKIEIEERVPMLKRAKIIGDISFYEFWSLAYETPEDDRKKIQHVLVDLGIKSGTERLTAGSTYDLLCKWKENSSKAKQGELLRKALEKANFDSRWMQLCEQRENKDIKVPHTKLVEIMVNVDNQKKIQQFLNELIPDKSWSDIVEGSKYDLLEQAIKVMRKWSRGPFEENPFALLSLALERSGCSSFEWIFFDGKISFFEIWSLSHYLKDDNRENIRSVFQALGLVIEDVLTGEELLYSKLCSWKDTNQTINQGKYLHDALDKANLKKAWKHIYDLRRRDTAQVSQHTLEHILWHIKEPKKIDQFLQKLTLDDQGKIMDVTRGLRATIQDAMKYLNIWMKQGCDENPLVLLSLALETMGCRPIDRSYFKVPSELTQEIDKYQIRSFSDSLTRRHIRKLTKYLNISKTEDTMNKENKETIFDTESMISDWIAQQECSNYEKRCKLNKAVDLIGRQDLKEFFGDMKPVAHIGIDYGTATTHTKDAVQDGKVDNQTSDFIKEEYQRIATYLSPSQIKNLFGHVGDSGNPQSAVQSYAEHRMAKKSNKNWREKLREKLKPVGFQALMPSELEDNVYLCELLDVAFRLLLEDVYPLAKTLGISDKKLKQYRVDYVPHHLTRGTTAALIKFSETKKHDRNKMCEALSDAGFRNIALLLEYGHATSLADEFAVASTAGNKGEALANISKNIGMTYTETVLRDWKTSIHSPSYNHRTSLADAVFPVLGKDVAIAILTGNYRQNGSESSAVIQTLINGIQSFDEPLISNILNVIPRPHGSNQVDEQQSDGITKSSSSSSFIKGERKEVDSDVGKANKYAVARKMADILDVNFTQHASTQERSPITLVLHSWEAEIKKKPLSRNDRKELSDNLLKAGFKEFSFEIMTGFVARPIDKHSKRGKRHKQNVHEQPDQEEKHDNAAVNLEDKNNKESTPIRSGAKLDNEKQVNNDKEVQTTGENTGHAEAEAEGQVEGQRDNKEIAEGDKEGGRPTKGDSAADAEVDKKGNVEGYKIGKADGGKTRKDEGDPKWKTEEDKTRKKGDNIEKAGYETVNAEGDKTENSKKDDKGKAKESKIKNDERGRAVKAEGDDKGKTEQDTTREEEGDNTATEGEKITEGDNIGIEGEKTDHGEGDTTEKEGGEETGKAEEEKTEKKGEKTEKGKGDTAEKEGGEETGKSEEEKTEKKEKREKGKGDTADREGEEKGEGEETEKAEEEKTEKRVEETEETGEDMTEKKRGETEGTGEDKTEKKGGKTEETEEDKTEKKGGETEETGEDKTEKKVEETEKTE